MARWFVTVAYSARRAKRHPVFASILGVLVFALCASSCSAVTLQSRSTENSSTTPSVLQPPNTPIPAPSPATVQTTADLPSWVLPTTGALALVAFFGLILCGAVCTAYIKLVQRVRKERHSAMEIIRDNESSVMGPTIIATGSTTFLGSTKLPLEYRKSAMASFNLPPVRPPPAHKETLVVKERTSPRSRDLLSPAQPAPGSSFLTDKTPLSNTRSMPHAAPFTLLSGQTSWPTSEPSLESPTSLDDAINAAFHTFDTLSSRSKHKMSPESARIAKASQAMRSPMLERIRKETQKMQAIERAGPKLELLPDSEFAETDAEGISV